MATQPQSIIRLWYLQMGHTDMTHRSTQVKNNVVKTKNDEFDTYLAGDDEELPQMSANDNARACLIFISIRSIERENEYRDINLECNLFILSKSEFSNPKRATFLISTTAQINKWSWQTNSGSTQQTQRL